MIKNEKYKGIAILLAMVVIGGVVKLRHNYSDTIIKKYGKVTTAYILSVTPYRKPTLPTINYFYIVDNDTVYYAKFVKSIIDFSKLQSLKGKTLLVMYDSTNVKESRLLINEDEYK